MHYGWHLDFFYRYPQKATSGATYSAGRIHLLCLCAPDFGPSALGQNYVQLGSIFSMNFEGCVRLGQIDHN